MAIDSNIKATNNARSGATELIKLGFNQETVDSLMPALESSLLVKYEPGDTIYREGDAVEFLYLINNGRIKLLNYLENGRARIVRLHKRGSIIGINGLMAEPHPHTAIAVDDVSIYQLPLSALKKIKQQDLNTYCQLLEYLNNYLSVADTWITDFSTGAIRGRVARLLRYLIENDENTGPREVTLLTVEEMAEILGVTAESVSRVMADLKRKNILTPIGDEYPDRFQCAMQDLLQEAEL